MGMKNFDDPDAFDESLKITEEAVEAQANEPPAIIWLQWYDNPEVTWERDNIHEDDVKYGLYSEIERLRVENERLLDALKELEDCLYEHSCFARNSREKTGDER